MMRQPLLLLPGLEKELGKREWWTRTALSLWPLTLHTSSAPSPPSFLIQGVRRREAAVEIGGQTEMGTLYHYAP